MSHQEMNHPEMSRPERRESRPQIELSGRLARGFPGKFDDRFFIAMQRPGIMLSAMVFILAVTTAVEASGPWRSSPSNTSGWQLMTPEERVQHQARVRGFTNYESCEEYRTRHQEQMRLRAEERGQELPREGHDFCSHLKQHKGD